MLSEWFNDLRFRLRAIFRRDALERELDDELRFHLEHEIEKLMKTGLGRAEATRRARVAFGGVERIKDDSRDVRGTRWLEVFTSDLRYAARGLRTRPGFTLAVVVTLALGVGANAAMFGVIDRLMLRAPAYLRQPNQVHRVFLTHTDEQRDETDNHFEYARYLDLWRWTRSLDAVAGYTGQLIAVGTGEDARELPVAIVSASLFGFFDAHPALGRFFNAQEDSLPLGATVVVLGHAYWQTHYGSRADVLGQQVQIGPVPFTIIGVAPEDFMGMETEARPAFYIPITTYAGMKTLASGQPVTSYYTRYNWGWMQMLVRRKPGVRLDAATADLTNAYRRSWEAERALRKSPGVSADVARPYVTLAGVQPGRGPGAARSVKVALWLGGVAVAVLLIACANVANLLLARALARRREIAVRLALGVSRARLLGQLLAESVLLAVLGGVAGLLVAQIAGSLLERFFLPKDTSLGIVGDVRTLLFAMGVALVAGLLTGLAPALHAGREDLATTLKAGAREGTYYRSRARTLLLVVQGALSVVLLVGAGLFVRSLWNVRALRLGYDVEPVLYVYRNLRGARLTPAAQADLGRRVLEEAKTIPGVMSAARVVSVPFWDTEGRGFVVPGIDSASWKMGQFTLQAATPEYFTTTGTRILRGRGIADTDRFGTPGVVVVSDAMARRLWPGKEPLGQCIKMDNHTTPCITVVGVAESIKQNSLTEDAGFNYYLPLEQFDSTTGGLFIRTRGEAAPYAETVRRRLQRLMPGAAYVTVTPMREIVDPNIHAWQLGATMFLAFGGLALALAAIGLYSVIAYNVAQRSRDLGVRIALGAGVADVLRLIVGEGVRFATAGVVIGGAIALAAGRWLAGLLFDESPRDPLVFGAVAVLLVIVAVIASMVPAMRATRVDPNVALRAE